jgi:putative nucleotidyltransferase with HDIG domain
MQPADDILDGITTLPPAPQVLPRLLEALADPDSDTSNLVDLITFDPALTARLLRAVNSALVASATQIKDVPEAVNRLGMNAIYQIVAAVHGARSLRPSCPDWGIDPAAMWQHSVTTALAAQFLARDSDEDEGVAFTAGLLHDLGKIVLAEFFKNQYAETLAEPNVNPAFAWDAEKRRFGVDHSEMGGRLLARWKFPAPIITSVWHHHAPGLGESFDRLSACVTLANAIAHEVEHGGALAALTEQESAAFELLNISRERVEYYLEETRENLAFVQTLCRAAA